MNYDDGMTTTPGEVTEAVVSTADGKRLEMTLLVSSSANSNSHAVGENSGGKRHPSGNGIKPECKS